MLVARSWWLAVSLTLGCRAGVFACEGPDECASAGEAGVCQPDGWCSFPSDECPSGQRYGEHAGDGLANTCVDDGGTTTSTTADETTKTTSIDTTLTETSLTETSLDTDAETTTTVSSTVADTSESHSMSGPTTDETMTTSTPNVCGDGIVADDEACDLGDENGNGGPCRDDCQLNVCGDGYVGPGEQCEPDVTESCNDDCTLFTCGDGELDPGEQCDPNAPLTESCETYGYFDGMLACTMRCTITTTGCDGCGKDGCQFPPCDDACPEGEHCVSYLDGEVCTASCNSDDDCASDIAGVLCENNECVLPCEFQDDCPFMEMACFNGQCAYAANP